ncbi:PTS system sucrose-specific IIC component [Alkalihalobacillus xiaoxiensis]|uniref:protein-N(pi)-phosphohistidine--sucrose phosphotransferase n=1 Tax=Shouchella xiaoxiensis TaxID=766895 RepID=A0ABS2SUN3_9BACI|nr:sucrose-specific PTS transporter subunit IIBC [Shouchella xiaoxiensis]MBM7839254.1 PTS system sucrose-specific IIC component [Shouchella xiaoxiensis]
MNSKKVASDIVTALGGPENIVTGTHCATRLRLVLQDEALVDEEKLNQLDVVKGTFSTQGQYQIIIGAGTVNTVYAQFVKEADLNENTSKEEVKQAGSKKMNPFQRLIKTLSDIFVPIIPAIVAGGLLMGIHNVLTSAGLFFDDQSIIEAFPQIEDFASMVNLFANAAFVFLPVLIGFSAAKQFGGNAYLGAALGMIMVHPDLLNAYGAGEAALSGDVPTWSIFSLEIGQVGYQGTVLPVLAAAFLLAKIEQFFRKIVPSVLDNLLTPLLTLFITGFLTFTVIGPFMRSGGDWITQGLVFLYETVGPIGGAIFGALYAPIVITGVHHSFIAIEVQLLADIARTGGTFIFPIASAANVAQGAAALTVFWLTTNQKMKGTASASGISALLGITEPAIFGVNLKLRFPFYAALIGSSVAAAYITWQQVLSGALGPAGIPGVIAIRPDAVTDFIIGISISFIVTVVMTIVFSKTIGKKQDI